MAAAATSTTTWPGAGLGAANSPHRGVSPNASRIAALMRAVSPGIRMPAASFGQDVGPTAHVAAPPELVGREPELEAVRVFVDALGDGPRGLLIEGEAGIGKTAVWRAAIA